MRQTTLKNRTGWMIAASTMLFCMALGTTPSQAADRVVVVPLGQSGAPVAKTGQTTLYLPGDDGDLEKGVGMSGRFKDNGNGTVTDGLTGLIWLKKGNCFGFYYLDPNGILGANERSWANAITAANNLANGYCELLDGSKAGDWRLPNRKELDSLLDLGRSYPALPVGCPLTNFGSFWSSTTNAAGTGKAWLVDLQSGDVFNDLKPNTYYVRAVRGGQ